MKFLRIISPLIVVYAVNYVLDTWFFVYQFFPWFDIPMHAIGGLVTAFVIARMLASESVQFTPIWLRHVFIVAGVATIAVVWELYEYIHDFFFPRAWQLGIADLFGDVIIGVIGALVYLFVSHLALLWKDVAAYESSQSRLAPVSVSRAPAVRRIAAKRKSVTKKITEKSRASTGKKKRTGNKKNASR